MKTIQDSKDCWVKLCNQYEFEGLVHVQHIWVAFAHCKFEGGSIEQLICATYRVALNKCAAVDIVIPNKIQVIQFIAILDDHFEDWSANKREQMHQHPLVVPNLDSLMNKIIDKCKRSIEKIDSASLRSSFHSTSQPSLLHHDGWIS